MFLYFSDTPMFILRSVGGYFIALIVVRIMGKRSIGELSAFDFVLMAGIGDIMSFIIVEKDVPFYDGAAVLLTLAVLEILLSYLAYKSRTLGKLIEGKPSYLIDDGNIVKENLKKEKISMYDIRQELRKQGIDDKSQVKKALIETCGKFTVILKEEEEPLKRKDLGIHSEGDSPQYLDKKFSDIRKEIDRLNTSVNNLIIEINKINNKE